MNISLPRRLKAFVDDKVASGRYGSASEFVREAIREKIAQDEQTQQAREALAIKLMEALESGPGVEFDDRFTVRRKQVLRERLASAGDKGRAQTSAGRRRSGRG